MDNKEKMKKRTLRENNNKKISSFIKKAYDNMVLIKNAFAILNIKALRIKQGECPICGKTIFIKLSNKNLWSIRCLKCGGSVAAISMAATLKNLVPDYKHKAIYELSSQGAFWKFLKNNVPNLTFSEFFDSIRHGLYFNGVQCQDVQCLTFKDESFDICTSTEVFEHVPNDHKGFSEIYRVLKPGGLLLFTVPLSKNKNTVERVRLAKNGKIIYLLKAEYHNDQIRGPGTILCYRNYGYDIIKRLEAIGFTKIRIIYPPDFIGWGYTKSMIAAYKRNS